MSKKCLFCGKEIDEKNQYGKGLYCNKGCQLNANREKIKRNQKIKAENRRKEREIIKYCKNCGKEFKTLDDSRLFCSRECSNTYSGNKSHKKSTESKLKVSESLKEYYKSIGYSKTLCTRCGKELKKKTLTGLCFKCYHEYYVKSDRYKQECSERAKKLMEEGKIKPWQSRNIESYPEKFWKQVLFNNKIKFDREFPIKKENGYCYFIDFLIIKNDKKIDLEIDGRQHEHEDIHNSDIERDFYISSLGYIIYRIKWNEINSNSGSESMKKKIEEFINFYNSLN